MGWFAGAIPAASAADLNDPEIRARLNRGECVSEVRKLAGTHTLVGRVTGVIDAPPAQVWAALSDYNHQAEYMPRLKVSFMLKPEVLDRVAGIPKLKDAVPILRDFIQDSLISDTVYEYDYFDFPFPVSDRRCIVRSVLDPVSFTSHYVQVVGDIKVNDGSWQLLQWNGRTLAIYTSRADIGTIIPDFLIKLATRHVLPEVIEGVRRHVAEAYPKASDER